MTDKQPALNTQSIGPTDKPVEAEAQLSGLLKGLFGNDGNPISADGGFDPGIDDDFESTDISESVIDPISNNSDASDPGEVIEPALDQDGDLIFADEPAEARIPDPEAGEITHEEFLSQGFSPSALVRQQAADMSRKTQAELERGIQNNPTINQSLHEEFTRPGVAGAVSGLVGLAIAIPMALASKGGYAVAKSVAEFSHSKSTNELRTALDDAGMVAADLHVRSRSAVEGILDPTEKANKLDEFFSRQDNAENAERLADSIDRAKQAAMKIIRRTEQLGTNNPDKVVSETVGLVAKFKKDNREVLEAIKFNGESLSVRVEGALKGLFDVARNFVSLMMNKLGATANQEGAATSTPAPGMR
ncbi:MAG: hypothetical protein V7693_16240 [Halopseudomonas sabulinigri]